MADEENVTNCICSYYSQWRSTVHISPVWVWIVLELLHLQSTVGPSHWYYLAFSSPALREAVHWFTRPWLSSGVEELSVQSGQHSWNSSDSVKNLFMRFRVTSHRHVLLLLALKNNISTVFTLPIFSLIYSYVPVNVVFTPNYWILVKSTNYVTPLMVFPSKCIANCNWIAAENFFCRFTAKCKL